MIEETSVIEIDIPASDWDTDLKWYAQIFDLDLDKGKADGNTLIFSQSNSEIRLIKVDNDQQVVGTRPIRTTVRVDGTNPFKVVENWYKAYLAERFFSIQEPHRALGPGDKTVILAYVGFGDPCDIGDPFSEKISKVVCIIHNPDWTIR